MVLVLIMDTAPADAQTATCRPWCRERSAGTSNRMTKKIAKPAGYVAA
jgi:hypothetical protein